MGYKHWKYQSTANWNLIDSNSQESIELAKEGQQYPEVH